MVLIEEIEAREEENDEKTDAHGQKLLGLEEELNDVKIKLNDLLQIVENDRENQKALEDRVFSVENQLEKWAIMKEEQEFEKFRKDCQSVFDLYIKSKTAFNEKEITIISVINAMNRPIPMDSIPEVTSINKPFIEFSNAIENLDVLDRSYRELCFEVEEKIEDFKEQIFKIDMIIRNCGMDRMQLFLEENLRKDAADLELFYKTAKRFLKDLSELMAQFKISPSRNVRD